jgi:hypothetical protein
VNHTFGIMHQLPYFPYLTYIWSQKKMFQWIPPTCHGVCSTFFVLSNALKIHDLCESQIPLAIDSVTNFPKLLPRHTSPYHKWGNLGLPHSTFH